MCGKTKQHEAHKHYRSPAKQTHQRTRNEPVNQIFSIFKTKKSDQSECIKILGKWRKWRRRDPPHNNTHRHKLFWQQTGKLVMKKLSSQF